MADSEHSSSDRLRFQIPSNDTFTDSGASGETSEESKLDFSVDEEMLIIRMYNLVGKRWPLIAGRIPRRTAEEIEKYWTSRYSTNERTEIYCCPLSM
ncbi:MYB-like transcription factor ETC3 [Juglans microcarpa x Juglans regia]|uniref:MYB-like transcription factor ETC3 n=1 Tax=Juglans microcarpa x Juglans regia TaxID=2249226 RepID=UPI001B7D9104|nr:MYB-like transcription factor ETC3 [Juglans microcarpa x Juglans regia]